MVSLVAAFLSVVLHPPTTLIDGVFEGPSISTAPTLELDATSLGYVQYILAQQELEQSYLLNPEAAENEALGVEQAQGFRRALKLSKQALTNIPSNTRLYGQICHILGYLYRHGWGTPKDLQKAIHWFKQAAKHTDDLYDWLCLAAIAYRQGQIKQSYAYFTQVLRKNPTLLHLIAGLQALQQRGDILEAIEQFSLFDAFCFGHKPPSDVMAAAYTIFTTELKKGEEWEHGLLRLITTWSSRVEEFKKFIHPQVIVPRLRAIKEGQSVALPYQPIQKRPSLTFPLERYSLKHRYPPQEWVRRCQEAKTLQESWAWNNRGYFYKTGLGGCSKDPQQAFKWIYKAATAPRAEALPKLNLAALYYNGVGTPVNRTLAYHWFCEALKTFPPLFNFFAGLQALYNKDILHGLYPIASMGDWHPLPEISELDKVMKLAFLIFGYFITQGKDQEHRFLQLASDWMAQLIVSPAPIPSYWPDTESTPTQ